MPGRFLLDTNAVIAVFANDSAALSVVSTADECFLCTHVIGELYYGAYRSQNIDENVARIERFSETIAVLPCDPGTAKQYGQIKNALRAAGRPIPENDIWITATAMLHDLTLLTNDRHFDAVSDFHHVAW